MLHAHALTHAHTRTQLNNHANVFGFPQSVEDIMGDLDAALIAMAAGLQVSTRFKFVIVTKPLLKRG